MKRSEYLASLAISSKKLEKLSRNGLKKLNKITGCVWNGVGSFWKTLEHSDENTASNCFFKNLSK